MIFQDPMSSLNPRHTIGRILTEPVLLHGLAQDHAAALALVQGVLDRVGLQRNTVERYSFELSGGQRQRVGIARAVMLRPDFVLADEIVSGPDVSTQAQVLRLLKELTRGSSPLKIQAYSVLPSKFLRKNRPQKTDLTMFS